MNRELLEQPFDRSLIKSRKGPFGQSLSYVEGAEVVRRLNEALDGEWTFEITAHQVQDNEVVVIGKLTTNGVVKMAFGGSSLTVSRDGQIVSVADDLKAAATDALKKAASLLGVGLHLYSSDQHPDSPARNGNGNGSSNGNGNGHYRGGNGAVNGNRITQKQLSAIWSLGRSLGLSSDQIRQQAMEEFGSSPEQLSKSDASSMISAMSENLGGMR